MFSVVRESVGEIHSLIPYVTSCEFNNSILALGLGFHISEMGRML